MEKCVNKKVFKSKELCPTTKYRKIVVFAEVTIPHYGNKKTRYTNWLEEAIADNYADMQDSQPFDYSIVGCDSTEEEFQEAMTA